LKSSLYQRLEIIKTRRSGLFIKKRSALFLGKAHSINKGLGEQVLEERNLTSINHFLMMLPFSITKKKEKRK
jgi:hypothetical protein